MSRTHYESAEEIEARIDRFTEKRDRNLKLAEWLECGAKWLRQESRKESPEGMSNSACNAEDEAAKLRSAAAHEDEVTLPKLKAKLAEITTAPLLGIGETTVARK